MQNDTSFFLFTESVFKFKLEYYITFHLFLNGGWCFLFHQVCFFLSLFFQLEIFALLNVLSESKVKKTIGKKTLKLSLLQLPLNGSSKPKNLSVRTQIQVEKKRKEEKRMNCFPFAFQNNFCLYF